MTTLPSWLLALLVALLSVAPVLSLLLMYLNLTRLMRAFGVKHEIPLPSMEGKISEAVEKLIPQAPPKQKMSVQVPGAHLFRKPQ